MMDPDIVNPSAVQFERVGDHLVPVISFSAKDGQIARRPADGAQFFTIEQVEAASGISARRLKRVWLGAWGYVIQHILTGV